MDDNQNALDAWMTEQNITSSELAEQLGFSYEYVYKLRNGQARIGNGFKWSFGRVFGFDLAESLFDATESIAA